MKQDNARMTGALTFLVDFTSMITSFLLAAVIRRGILTDGILRGIYGDLLFFLLWAIIIVSYLNKGHRNIFKRGYYAELASILKEQGQLALAVLAYMFFLHVSTEYSRIFLALFFCFQILITYVLRSYLKLVMLLGYKKSAASSKVMLITVSKQAAEVIRRVRREYEWTLHMNSIALWDKDLVGESIEGIEVVANRENLFEMARQNVVDEVFIHIPRSYKIDMEELVLNFEEMGITVHVNLDILGNIKLKEKVVEEYAGHQVITFSTAIFDIWHAVIKRAIDILGGITGCILTAVLTIFLAPVIRLESKGPIFFSQTRIGKNGRRFKIYKFRSMYPDAEERKKELMDRNEMKGLMFKVTDDPRITRVGKFIRKTSLDEFPQFLNVLMGDMSLVGTRPPTEDEFLKYESRHKRRLSLKPGLTGLWQVSGRSDIDNFEDVVKMDLEYIDNWSLGLDIKLVVKTVLVVLFGRGAR